MSNSSFYKSLSTVKTTFLNAIIIKYSNGRPTNIDNLLKSIVDELDDPSDWIESLSYLTETELLDLGFNFYGEEFGFMLFPAWLYYFLPDGTRLQTLDGDEIVKGDDPIIIVADNWVDAIIYLQ